MEQHKEQPTESTEKKWYVVTTYSGAQVTKTATGTYSVDHPTTKAGTHTVRFEGTGALAAAEELQFYAIVAAA